MEPIEQIACFFIRFLSIIGAGFIFLGLLAILCYIITSFPKKD